MNTNIRNSSTMFVPDPWEGPLESIILPDYFWLRNLRGKVYCRLSQDLSDHPLPDGYDLYVVDFRLESIDLDIISNLAKQVKKPIIVLGEVFEEYDYLDPNLNIYNYLLWHKQFEKVMLQWPRQDISQRTIVHKASAICHRATWSKLLITVALLEEMGTDCVVKLSQWVEPKNINFGQPYSNQTLDDLTSIYFKKYAGKEIILDAFTESNNFQKNTMNPWIPWLQSSALHFTNETWAYSLMQTGDSTRIYPGPFLSEKTFKAMLGGCAFIPVGQYNTYSTLSRLGLRFNYPFDISWDQDPGNLSRMESIIKLIRYLKQFSAAEIYDMVKESAYHNFEVVWSGQFYRLCEKINQKTVEDIMQKFG